MFHVCARLLQLRQSVVITCIAVGYLAPCLMAQDQPQARFDIHFSEQAFSKPFTGDVYVAFAQQGEPRSSMHRWFGAPPLARFHVQNVKPGERVQLSMDDARAASPSDWSEAVDGQTWKLQAVARVNPIGRTAGQGDGDVYGEPVEVEYPQDEAISLSLTEVVINEPMKETERTRHFTIQSRLLSDFHGRPYSLHAGVLLPKDFDPDATYPTVYSITGFGGTHRGIARMESRMSDDDFRHNCIVVIPDASNLYGHSVFCDSESIGPWGTALVDELIPALEKKYGGAGARHRYVTGVSSGGWSSLWLQVTYPDAFAGCWSHVPDPIDFHDFQQINLYDALPDGSPRNMYVDESGQPRPLARGRGGVRLTYEEFVRREHVTNPGGQIRSFEATFSPSNSDGTPQRVFDVDTGAIDHSVAQSWRKYDISHILLSSWDQLRPQLRDKIHVYAGEVDSFYLEGAVERFQALAREAGMLDDMVVEIIPDMAHSLHAAGQEDMLKTIEQNWLDQKND